MPPTYILTIRCPDRRGIVAVLTGFLAERGCSIVEAHQHQDAPSGTFFMRALFTADEATDLAGSLREDLVPIARQFDMDKASHACHGLQIWTLPL